MRVKQVFLSPLLVTTFLSSSICFLFPPLRLLLSFLSPGSVSVLEAELKDRSPSSALFLSLSLPLFFPCIFPLPPSLLHLSLSWSVFPVSEAEDQITQGDSEALWQARWQWWRREEGGGKEIRFHISSALLCLPRLPPPPPPPAAWRQNG